MNVLPRLEGACELGRLGTELDGHQPTRLQHGVRLPREGEHPDRTVRLSPDGDHPRAREEDELCLLVQVFQRRRADVSQDPVDGVLPALAVCAPLTESGPVFAPQLNLQ